jgi:hypothetical protein
VQNQRQTVLTSIKRMTQGGSPSSASIQKGKQPSAVRQSNHSPSLLGNYGELKTGVVPLKKNIYFNSKIDQEI